MPAIAVYLDAVQLGVLTGSSSCSDLRPDHDPNHLKQTVEDLRRRLASKPDDLCVGNQYRQNALPYHSAESSSPEALPPELAELAQASTATVEQLSLTEDDPGDNVSRTRMARELNQCSAKEPIHQPRSGDGNQHDRQTCTAAITECVQNRQPK